MRPKCPACGWIHFANPSPAAGTISHPPGDLTQILLVERAINPFKGTWGIPAGFEEADETPESCAIRETHEETGAEIRIVSLFDVGYVADDPRKPAVLIVYEAEITGGTIAGDDDAADARLFKISELPTTFGFANTKRVIERWVRERANPRR
jgi:ADP-ribose pyrophosphatase YjhB (NUDIX family)